MQLETDTIVAIATPPGRGGIGVVRLSGPEALAISARLTRTAVLVSHRARYGFVHDAAGERLDDALVTWFAAPHSYTGEDVVEISTHGSPIVLATMVQLALHHGARLARAGEFTERAYLQGRLDLTAAEAVRDLIEAQTLAQAHLAAQQMGGALRHETEPAKVALVALIAALEAGIDFAEDDLDTLPFATIRHRIAQVLHPLRTLEASFARGRLVREGLKLAIVGRPNVGKSSLFNCLLGRDRAIVTAVPGTTRDVVSEPMVLDGLPVQLLDTAGLRETSDEVERIGVARTREVLAEADVVLLVVDASEIASGPRPSPLDHHGHNSISTSFQAEPWHGDVTGAEMAAPENGSLLGKINGRPCILVENKCDLAAETSLQAQGAPRATPLDGRTANQQPGGSLERQGTAPVRTVRTSALTGEGIDTLRAAILTAARGEAGVPSAGASLTNLRQHQAVHVAVQALTDAEAAALQNTPHEMLLLDLYAALQALDALTGATTPDDVLQLIFSTFCIGK